MQEGTKAFLKTAAATAAVDVGYNAIEERQAQQWGYTRGPWDRAWSSLLIGMVIVTVLICGGIIVGAEGGYDGMKFECWMSVHDDAYCDIMFPDN